jgi:hypothetical protein
MNLNNPSSYEVTFETKCYENDWEFILKSKFLDRMINNCNYNFCFKHVIINNVNDSKLIKYYANKKKKEKIIDAFYFVDDYIEDALNYFDIKKESFGNGYYYSSAELVGLFVAKSKYLLHFSSDSFIPKKDESDWIAEACNIFEKEPNIVVANPTWFFQFNTAREEAGGNMAGNFYLGYGFSDQCYLVKTEDFRAKIYNFKHSISDRYPQYGGELFEKRIDSYMRVNGKKRITSNKISYIHNNFPKKFLLKKIILFLIQVNVYNFICIIYFKVFINYKQKYSEFKYHIKKLIREHHNN